MKTRYLMVCVFLIAQVFLLRTSAGEVNDPDVFIQSKLNAIKLAINENDVQAQRMIQELLNHEDSYYRSNYIYAAIAEYYREVGEWGMMDEYLEKGRSYLTCYGCRNCTYGWCKQENRNKRERISNFALAGDYNSAMNAAKLWLKENKSPQRHFLQGQIAYLKQDFEAALNSLLEAQNYYINPYYKQLTLIYQDRYAIDLAAYRVDFLTFERAKEFYLSDPFFNDEGDEVGFYGDVQYLKQQNPGADGTIIFDHRMRYLAFLFASYRKLDETDKALEVLNYGVSEYPNTFFSVWLKKYELELESHQSVKE